MIILPRNPSLHAQSAYWIIAVKKELFYFHPPGEDKRGDEAADRGYQKGGLVAQRGHHPAAGGGARRESNGNHELVNGGEARALLGGRNLQEQIEQAQAEPGPQHSGEQIDAQHVPRRGNEDPRQRKDGDEQAGDQHDPPRSPPVGQRADVAQRGQAGDAAGRGQDSHLDGIGLQIVDEVDIKKGAATLKEKFHTAL